MTAINWNAILDWKLLEGSHEFPGPDGGTCINEAAVLTAGLEYRPILSENDFPPCFSKPIGAYLMCLNDEMEDDDRAMLMPFVVRLSGSAGSADVEKRRGAHLALETLRRITSRLFETIGRGDVATRLRKAQNLDEALGLLSAHRQAIVGADGSRGALREAALVSSEALGDDPEEDGAYATDIANRAGGVASQVQATIGGVEVWEAAVEIAAEAFAIGAAEKPIDAKLAARRLSDAKRKATDEAAQHVAPTAA